MVGNEGPAPLSTSKLSNIQAKPAGDTSGKASMPGVDKKVTLSHRRLCVPRPKLTFLQKPKADRPSGDRKEEVQPGSMEALLGKLQQQQEVLAKKAASKKTQGDETLLPPQAPIDESNVLTPTSDFSEKESDQKKEDLKLKREAIEMSLLKKELDAARDQIARQKQELDESRVIKQSFDHVVGPASEAALSPKLEASGHAFSPPSSYAFVPRQTWSAVDDAPLPSFQALALDLVSGATNLVSIREDTALAGSMAHAIPRCRRC